MSAKAFGFGALAALKKYLFWVNQYISSWSVTPGYSIYDSTTKQIYTTNYTYVSTTYTPYIATYDATTGALVSNQGFSASTDYLNGLLNYLTQDTNYFYFISGNKYAVTRLYKPTFTANSWGTYVSWSVGGGNFSNWGLGTISGNVIVVGTAGYYGGGCCCPSYYYATVFKTDSSGAVGWYASYGGTTNSSGFFCAAGNGTYVYAGGTVAVSGRAYDGAIFKFDSSGLVSSYTLNFGGVPTNITALSCFSDSTLAFSARDSGFGYIKFGRFDPASTNNWAYTTNSSLSDPSYSNCVDSSNNSYYIAPVTGSSYAFAIFKFNFSGTLQWQRTVTFANVYRGASNIVANNDNNSLIITVNNQDTVSGQNNSTVIVLPMDGSKTGTYTNNQTNSRTMTFTYASSSYTLSSTSWSTGGSYSTTSLGHSTASISSFSTPTLNAGLTTSTTTL